MTAPLPSTHRRAVGMLVLATLCWGLSFPVVKALVLLQGQILPQSSGSFIVACVLAPRFILALALLALWQWRPWRGPKDRAGPALTRGEMSQGLRLGLFSSAGMILQNDGLRFTAASTSAFLTQFYAIMIPVWLVVRHRRRPSPVVVICCALVLVGVGILGRFDWATLRLGRGEWETLAASAFFMGQILSLEAPAASGNRALPVTLAMFGVQAALFTALAGAAAPELRSLLVPWHNAAWVGLTVALAVVCTIGAYTLMNAWQPRISATEAGLIYCGEPIFGSLLAVVLPAFFSRWAAIDYPNETATANLLVGGALITGANLLIQLRPPARAAA